MIDDLQNYHPRIETNFLGPANKGVWILLQSITEVYVKEPHSQPLSMDS